MMQAQKACDLMAEALRNDSMSWPSGVDPDIVAMHRCSAAIRDLLSKNKVLNPISVSNVADIDKNVAVYNRALFWTGVWQHIASKDHDPSVFASRFTFHLNDNLTFLCSPMKNVRSLPEYVTNIQLLTARLARKHQNDKLSQRILLDHADWTVGGQGIQANSLINMLYLYNQQPPSEDVVCVQREGSKLLYRFVHFLLTSFTRFGSLLYSSPFPQLG